ncbi:hypothetical protein LZ575_10170 [Antarcticibacterium sp. 1MA-6-2]|uniref:hypothetical protein n=1 Tax=Antarcticibacterium sp. 1MA-6-2 TaxID=2908210 RepID=UPI001F246F73|nr:hypothetical protein [Antarcticibacterium sp. 1MA-6-2]UJH92763.1 hypothetical protein LZ575_10170 [Antarcticibacterium sp. 1MA-6-2]
MKSIFTILSLLVCVLTQAQDFRFGKVSKEEVLEAAHPVDGEADAAVLYRKISTHYQYSDNGFTLVTDVHERIKIYNKDGFDWATRELRQYQDSNKRENISGLKGYTYNIVEGKLVDEKLKNDGIFEEEASKYLHKTRFTMLKQLQKVVLLNMNTLYVPLLLRP